jgi:hypothetical protein
VGARVDEEAYDDAVILLLSLGQSSLAVAMRRV